MTGAPQGAIEATQFGKYSLVAKIAKGGMAEILLARQLGVAGFEKLICIKRILPDLAKDPQFVSMFLDEARIAARISHPNVCQVFDLGEVDGSYYMAMEYLEGVPLASFRRKDLHPSPPDPQLVVGIAVQFCEGLHHAHQLTGRDGELLGVVHRDVSGQNVFVTVDGIAKVLDFGIAKVQDATMHTNAGTVKGTYAYMAPEQLRNETLDRRVDVFAAGIVVWETLAQRPLFRRETDFLTFQAITSEEIPDVCTFRNDVPPAIGEVIAKALARDREDRYPTARAFGEALAKAAVAIGGPTTAAAISEEVTRAFALPLREQRALIQFAREGGAHDLARDQGPALGQGTELVTTPVSNLRSRDSRPLAAEPEPPLAARRDSRPLAAQRDSRPLAAQAVIPQGARSDTLAIQAVSAPVRWRVAAGVATALVAAALVWFFVLGSPRATVVPTDAAADRVMPVAASATTPSTSTNVVDASVAAATDASAVVSADVTTEAVVAPSVATVPARTTTAPKRTGTAPRGGAPGRITIDAKPFAKISIDGKSYGVTPLVNLELPPGRYALRAESPTGKVREMKIVIESGKVAPAQRIVW